MGECRVLRIARLVKELTYDEMMDVADAFSDWTLDDGGNHAISSHEMASNLAGWADLELAAAEDAAREAE